MRMHEGFLIVHVHSVLFVRIRHMPALCELGSLALSITAKSESESEAP